MEAGHSFVVEGTALRRAGLTHTPQGNCNRREHVPRLRLQHTHTYHKHLNHPAVYRIQTSSTESEPTHVPHDFKSINTSFTSLKKVLAATLLG
eukprot:1141084-Pelagomonas_calceolata.AAC.1